MASIRKRGERYYIRYRDAAGVQHEIAAGTKDRKRAADMARRMGDELETGYAPPGRRLTVAEAWELFDATVLPGKREGTRIAYRSAMRHNWLPEIGKQGLQTLRPEQVRKALDAMPLAASTMGLRRTQLSGLYKWAMSEGHAFRNPCRDVHMAPERRQDEEEEFHAAGITPRTLRHAYARLMLMLGMSLPELQRQMGHAKFDTTLRYAHYESKDRPLAVRALDSWGGLGGSKKGRYLPVDMDDRRKHAIGQLEGQDVANAPK